MLDIGQETSKFYLFFMVAPIKLWKFEDANDFFTIRWWDPNVLSGLQNDITQMAITSPYFWSIGSELQIDEVNMPR